MTREGAPVTSPQQRRPQHPLSGSLESLRDVGHPPPQAKRTGYHHPQREGWPLPWDHHGIASASIQLPDSGATNTVQQAITGILIHRGKTGDCSYLADSR